MSQIVPPVLLLPELVLDASDVDDELSAGPVEDELPLVDSSCTVTLVAPGVVPEKPVAPPAPPQRASVTEAIRTRMPQGYSASAAAAKRDSTPVAAPRSLAPPLTRVTA